MARSKAAVRQPGLAGECASLRAALSALKLEDRAEVRRIRKSVDVIERIAFDSPYHRDAFPLAIQSLNDREARARGGPLAAKKRAEKSAEQLRREPLEVLWARRVRAAVPLYW